MRELYWKEIKSWFSSPIAYMVIASFLLITGLIMWVFPDYSILENNYATLDQLFSLAPILFCFLVPALCMRMFAEERQLGTIELLMTRPLPSWKIIGAKWLAGVSLLILTLMPTLVYVYSVYALGSPVGNIDLGQIAGSYLGLIILGAAYTAIGLYASSLTHNQIVAFILALVLCVFMQWAFYFLSRFPGLIGFWDDVIQRIGMDYHYQGLRKGMIDSRDVIYFLSIIFFFLYLCRHYLVNRVDTGR